jgi:hypothetical protein
MLGSKLIYVQYFSGLAINSMSSGTSYTEQSFESL